MSKGWKIFLIIGAALTIIVIVSTINTAMLNNRRYKSSYTSSHTRQSSYTPRPTAKPASAPAPTSSSKGYTPKKSRTYVPEDEYGASEYTDPEWFYEDYYDDFESYEDAESYWEEYGDN